MTCHRMLLLLLLLCLQLLLGGCATTAARKPPPPPPEPLLRIGLTRVLELRPGAGEVAHPAWTAALLVADQSEEGAVARDLHQALVSALRQRGHLPSTVEPSPAMVAVDPLGNHVLAPHLPQQLQYLPEAQANDGIMVVGLSGWTRVRVEEGTRQQIDLLLGLYRTRDGLRVWSRAERWTRTYAEPPDPADLTDDLIDGMLQRGVPREGEEGPLPLLHDLPPAVAPPPPPPPPN